MCSKHYWRWQNYGDPLVTREPPPDTCTAEGCDKPHDSLGYCQMHYTRLRRHGDLNVRPNGNGAKPNEAISNTSFHRRLRRVRGNASSYECVQCGEPAAQWAHITGTDKRQFENYQPMCPPCHWAYDRDLHLAPDAMARWREGVGAYWTPERRAEQAEITRKLKRGRRRGASA